MINPITLIREGGPFIYLLLLMGPLWLLTPLAAGIAGGLKRPLPTAVFVFLGSLPITLGLWGTLIGLGQVLGALDHVSPEMRAPLAAQGSSLALFTVVAGAAIAAPMSAATGLMALATSFVPGTDEQAPTRAATLRHTAFSLFTLAGAAGAMCAATMSAAMYCNALAVASREMKAVLMANATEGLMLQVVVMLTFSAVAAFGGLVHVALVPAARTPRTAFGAVAGAAMLLPALGFIVVSLPRWNVVLPATVSWEAQRHEALQGVALPTATWDGELVPAPTLRIDAQGNVLQQVPGDGTLTLEAPGSIAIRHVLQHSHPRVRVTAQGPGGLLGVELTSTPDRELLPLGVNIRQRPWVGLQDLGHRQERIELPRGGERDAMASWLADDFPVFTVWATPETPVQEIFDALGALEIMNDRSRRPPSIHVVLGAPPVPPVPVPL